jgi:hypothetical protein
VLQADKHEDNCDEGLVIVIVTRVWGVGLMIMTMGMMIVIIIIIIIIIIRVPCTRTFLL